MKVCACGSSTEKPAKSMQKVVVVYIIYMHNFFCKKCICKVSDIRKHLYKKCVYLYTYIQAMSIKCIYFSAAAGRRYEQKVHILYIPIYLYGKVYTIYIHIEITNTVEILHPESRIHQKIFAGRISDRAQRALGASGNIYTYGRQNQDLEEILRRQR